MLLHAWNDLWSLCLFFSFSFVLLVGVISNTKGVENRVESPCVFVQSQRSLFFLVVSYIYISTFNICLIASVSASAAGGKMGPLIFPLMSSVIYLSMYFLPLFLWLCNQNARTAGSRLKAKKFPPSISSQE
jgi:hypothetical protein